MDWNRVNQWCQLEAEYEASRKGLRRYFHEGKEIDGFRAASMLAHLHVGLGYSPVPQILERDLTEIVLPRRIATLLN